MALHWSWKEKCGTVLVSWYDGNDERKTGNLSMYQGNAELIFLYGKLGKTFTMFSFWADREHMKNCLGLTKGNSNIYADDQNGVKFLEFTFYKNRMRDLPQIVTAIIKAFPRITINIEEADDETV